MGADKASLIWNGEPLWRRQTKLLADIGLPLAISVRPDQELPGLSDGEYECIADQYADAGPLAGFLSTWKKYPNHALLAVACDLPLLDAKTLGDLLEKREPHKMATAYQSANDGLPEPLCAIYEPAAHAVMLANLEAGRGCPRKILIEAGDDARLLNLTNRWALENANTPDDLERLRNLEKEALA